MNETSVHEFTMDPNLLVSVIKSQAGTLSKALAEGVMNSIDAGAKRIDITLSTEKFLIKDNGRGFTSEQEIRLWFGRFGTPHIEGDATFGRFRMGRGQLMAFASTEWRSGGYVMRVDIEGKGLNYELAHLDRPIRGCEIEGQLYQGLDEYKLERVLAELKTFVAFSPRPVYVNGELYGSPAAHLKTWSFEDDAAYYRISQESKELKVYNQGIFVEQIGAWRIGMGGTVVSKRPLQVNFARNSVLEERCETWKHIVRVIERMVFEKLAAARKLSDTERQFLARNLSKLHEAAGPTALRNAKLLTDPTGRHIALSELLLFTRFVHIRETSPRACAIHGRSGTFVVTSALLERFGADDIKDLLNRIEHVDTTLVASAYEIVTDKELGAIHLGSACTISAEWLPRRRLAAYHTLVAINTRLAERLVKAGCVTAPRKLLVGRHRGRQAIAWTDGSSYITANTKYLRLFEHGLDGVLEWLHTLVHEYTHDTDDSESHSHGEVFYQKFHETVFIGALALATLAHEGLQIYLRELKLLDLPQPHRLTRQLKGLFSVSPPRSIGTRDTALVSSTLDEASLSDEEKLQIA